MANQKYSSLYNHWEFSAKFNELLFNFRFSRVGWQVLFLHCTDFLCISTLLGLDCLIPRIILLIIDTFFMTLCICFGRSNICHTWTQCALRQPGFFPSLFHYSGWSREESPWAYPKTLCYHQARNLNGESHLPDFESDLPAVIEFQVVSWISLAYLCSFIKPHFVAFREGRLSNVSK